MAITYAVLLVFTSSTISSIDSQSVSFKSELVALSDKHK